MKIQLWKRLDAVQGMFAPQNYCITVRQRPGETIEETEARLERWRQGSEDEDINATPCAGEELVVILLNFLDQA
jgi:hypothetical protein